MTVGQATAVGVEREVATGRGPLAGDKGAALAGAEKPSDSSVSITVIVKES